jgi:hypothetical protein
LRNKDLQLRYCRIMELESLCGHDLDWLHLWELGAYVESVS